MWHFACGRWLSAHNDDGATRRLLLPGPPPVTEPQPADDAASEQQGRGCEEEQQQEEEAAQEDEEEEEEEQLADYRVEVQTGPDAAAGTSARVFVQFSGRGGGGETEARVLGPQQLEGDDGGGGGGGGAPLFARGGLDCFELAGMRDVGRPAQLRIGHDGSGPHPGEAPHPLAACLAASDTKQSAGFRLPW